MGSVVVAGQGRMKMLSGEWLGPCQASTARSPHTSEQNRRNASSLLKISSKTVLAESIPDLLRRRYRVRPKLLAIEVSGCHLVPVIAQASGRGRQARAGGHGQRDVTQSQDLG